MFSHAAPRACLPACTMSAHDLIYTACRFKPVCTCRLVDEDQRYIADANIDTDRFRDAFGCYGHPSSSSQHSTPCTRDDFFERANLSSVPTDNPAPETFILATSLFSPCCFLLASACCLALPLGPPLYILREAKAKEDTGPGAAGSNDHITQDACISVQTLRKGAWAWAQEWV